MCKKHFKRYKFIVPGSYRDFRETGSSGPTSKEDRAALGTSYTITIVKDEVAMASSFTVQGPANESLCNLEVACDASLCRLFPEWKRTDRTYMFPPIFPFRYIAPTGEASGAVPLSKDVKGDEAELRMFRALDKFGREDNQPMFVLTKFEFKEFTKQVLLGKLPTETVDSLFASLSIMDLRLEKSIFLLCTGGRELS